VERDVTRATRGGSGLIEYAIAAEHYARELYREFARLFAADPRVAAFWQRYSAEEMGHARWLEQLLKKLPPETSDAPADIDKLEAARHMIKAPLANALATVKTLEDAYQLAHELESSEMNTLFEFLLFTFADDPQAAQFARDQLRDHVARLSERFPEHYAGAANRRALLAAA
jgi:rubrerythrin